MSLVAALAALSAGLALAASPARNRAFSGRGRDYLNRSSTWKRRDAAHFSFRTSTDGSRLLSFRGTYAYYCGKGGSTAVNATYLTVNSSGSFDYPFKVRTKDGVVYVRIYGGFLSDGSRARVSYLIDYVGKGQKVPHPYDTSHPSALGCASWVQGTAAVPQPRTYVASNGCSGHSYRPATITIACATGQFYASNLRYSSYGGATATAAGQLHLDNCKPDCARGTFQAYQGEVRLERIGLCRGLPYYEEISWRYVGNAPPGPSSGSQSIAPAACSKP